MAQKEEIFETQENEIDFEAQNNAVWAKINSGLSLNDTEIAVLSNGKSRDEYVIRTQIEEKGRDALIARRTGKKIDIETPAQKLRRITLELQEVKEELNYIQAREKEINLAQQQETNETNWEDFERIEKELKLIASNQSNLPPLILSLMLLRCLQHSERLDQKQFGRRRKGERTQQIARWSVTETRIGQTSVPEFDPNPQG